MSLLAVEPAPPRDWFYRVDWQEKPLGSITSARTGAIVHDVRRLSALNLECNRLALANELGLYDALRPEFDRISAEYVVAALERGGVAFEPGVTLDTRSLRASLGVIEQHRRLFERTLAMLAEDGWLRRSGEQWQVLRSPEAATPDAECERLERECPALAAELRLLRSCGSRLLEVWRGVADPLQLLSEGGSFETLERLYIHSPGAKVFNPSASEALKAALALQPDDRPIRIIEIGAGTGGTTTYLAPAIAGRNVEYTYTDVSALFTARAQERFAEYPFFRYAVLDIEKPAAAQGFAPESFDIVIAANVLHATADLRATVDNVRRMLAPSGLLVLIEGTRPERWVDLTFGMTEGWWKFQDSSLRPEHALLTRAQWMELLEQEGFRAAVVEPDSGSQQVLLLAEAVEQPDRIRMRVVRAPGEYSCADCDVLAFDARDGGNCADLVSILQTATAQRTPPRVWLITSGAQPLTPGDRAIPDQAALWGIARTAALEYPDFWGGVVDIEPATNAEETILRESKSGSAEDQLVYRGGRRFAPRIVRDAVVRHSEVRFQSDGFHLITGGLGNLGLSTADWMVRHGARRLLLTGRTASRNQRAESIAALESLGATVDIVAADITTAAGVEAVRAALGDTRLRGIVHTAAVFGSTPIADLTPAALDAVLRPKQAAAALLDLAGGSPLEFVVLFSSTTALVGVSGMAAYAAANAYVDCLAHQARQAGVPAVAVNWGTWELMRDTSEKDRERYLRTGLHPMAPAQALSALGDVLAHGSVQAMVASIDWNTFKAVYESRRRRPLFESVSGPEVVQARAGKAEKEPDLRALLEDVPPSDRFDRVVNLVRGEAARVLGLRSNEVDPAAGLFELGMDSLMSIELKRRLEVRCGRSFPSTLTFNYPSVQALAGYIFEWIEPSLPEIPDPSRQAQSKEAERDTRDELSEDQLADLLAQALDGAA